MRQSGQAWWPPVRGNGHPKTSSLVVGVEGRLVVATNPLESQGRNFCCIEKFIRQVWCKPLDLRLWREFLRGGMTFFPLVRHGSRKRWLTNDVIIQSNFILVGPASRVKKACRREAIESNVWPNNADASKVGKNIDGRA